MKAYGVPKNVIGSAELSTSLPSGFPLRMKGAFGGRKCSAKIKSAGRGKARMVENSVIDEEMRMHFDEADAERVVDPSRAVKVVVLKSREPREDKIDFRLDIDGVDWLDEWIRACPEGN